MKFSNYILILILLFMTTGCPGGGYISDIKRVQNNNMDFPDIEKYSYNGINYSLSSLFSEDYDPIYVMSSNAEAKISYGLSLNFSIEAFNKEDAEIIQFSFDTAIDPLDAVHDNYILKRQASLYNGEITTIKKELPKNVQYPGYIQVVHGSSNSYDKESSYFTATMDIDGTYFVFQLIGKKENMGYLYDDFLDILSSVEKGI